MMARRQARPAARELCGPASVLLLKTRHLPHGVAHVVGDQQRPVPVHGHAHRAALRLARPTQEAGQDLNRIAGGLAAREGHEGVTEVTALLAELAQTTIGAVGRRDAGAAGTSPRCSSSFAGTANGSWSTTSSRASAALRWWTKSCPTGRKPGPPGRRSRGCNSTGLGAMRSCPSSSRPPTASATRWSRPIYRLNAELRGGGNPLLATPDEIERGLQGRLFIFAGVQSPA